MSQTLTLNNLTVTQSQSGDDTVITLSSPLAGTQTTYVSDETFTGWVDGVYGTYHYQITFVFS